MHRKYFIAIVLEEELFEKAESVKKKLFDDYGLKGALRSPAHITLHRPFEWKEEKESVLVEALQNFKFHSVFDIELNGFNCFEPRVIYIDIKKNALLLELYKNLAMFCQRNLKLANEINDERGFHPHITVAFRDLKKPLFYTLWEKFKSEKFSGRMKVSGFSLLRLDKQWDVIKNFNI